MSITANDIRDITAAVWSTMLEREVFPLHESEWSPNSSEGGAYVGVVKLSGAFEGAITVHVSPGMALQAAATLFELSREDLEESHVVDTVSELTNIIGGNVKCLVPQPTRLDLPRVITPANLAEELAQSLATARLALGDETGTIWVAVHQEQPNPQARAR